MAEDAPVIASAVVIPDASDIPAREPPSPTGADAAPSLKRRQSDISDTEPKRRRLSQDADSAGPGASPPRDERRKSRQLEERKRGQRLFGALLGTLSQGSSNAASKRRADIEKRQQAKLKQQDEEDSQRRKERLENLKAIRRKEQKKRDEKTMKIRHANMLHFANFLRTKTEPRLYYKPWELTPEQEDQVKEQLREAQDAIDRELEEFEQRKADDQEQEQEREHEQEQEGNERPSEHVIEGQEAHPVEPSTVSPELLQQEDAAVPMAGDDNMGENVDLATAPDDATSAPSSTTAVNEAMEEDLKDAVDDEQGETVVEADEDTVIY